MSPQLKEHLMRVWKKREQWEIELAEARQQNQIFIEDSDGQYISSLELVNSLENGKRLIHEGTAAKHYPTAAQLSLDRRNGAGPFGMYTCGNDQL